MVQDIFIVLPEVAMIRNAHTEEYIRDKDGDYKRVTLPMLTTQKAGIAVLGSMWNTAGWPMYFLSDIADFEKWLRRHSDPRWNAMPVPKDTMEWILR